jgi:hypothetical protein
MRPISIKLMSIIGLMVTLLLFVGCGGGGDLLDEVGNRYHGTAIPKDNDDTTRDIDVVWNTNCDNDATTIDPEPYTGFIVSVTIESDTTAVTGDTFNVESYTVSFRPNHGSYYATGVVAADMPDLIGSTLNPIRHNTSLLVEPGTSGDTIELPVWTVGDKDVYGAIVSSMPAFDDVGNTVFVYDIQVVLNCRTADDETFTITTPWTPLNFAGYNNC